MLVEAVLGQQKQEIPLAPSGVPEVQWQGGWGQTLGVDVAVWSRRVDRKHESAGSDGRRRLEELKKRHFSPSGKAERISRSLAALKAPNTIVLSAQEWVRIAEDPDIGDDF